MAKPLSGPLPARGDSTFVHRADPARRLYENFGFTYCAPVADCREDPNNLVRTLALATDPS